MQDQLFHLRGKKAVVTGGAIGVGRACATALAMSGADVAVVGRTPQLAKKTCESLREFGVDSFFVQCDVSDREQVEAMHAEVIQRFGRIDIGVNNAGSGVHRDAVDMTQDLWDRMIDVNLAGVFWCAQSQARQMIKQGPAGGKIINVASMYASIAAGNCAYNASKAGVVHLTRTLAVEWGGYNINVNCISPGWMLTRGNPVDVELRARMREITPLGGLVPYSAMYGPLILLSSAASDSITGLDLVVDGGHSLTTYLRPLTRSVPPRTSPELEEQGLREEALMNE